MVPPLISVNRTAGPGKLKVKCKEITKTHLKVSSAQVNKHEIPLLQGCCFLEQSQNLLTRDCGGFRLWGGVRGVPWWWWCVCLWDWVSWCHFRKQGKQLAMLVMSVDLWYQAA